MAIPAVSPWINKQKVLKTLCVLMANSIVELTGPSGWSSCFIFSSSAHFLANFVLFSLLNPAEIKKKYIYIYQILYVFSIDMLYISAYIHVGMVSINLC